MGFTDFVDDSAWTCTFQDPLCPPRAFGADEPILQCLTPGRKRIATLSGMFEKMLCPLRSPSCDENNLVRVNEVA